MALRRCYGCMNLIEETVCPHCGYSADQTNDQNHLPAGTVLRGQYLVGKVLGHGGFGITYIGWDLYLEMVVAIKEFYPASVVNRDTRETLYVRVNTADGAAHYEQSRERFLREAQTLAKLQNVPEIVGVQGFFTENNTAYIIMEYVRGIDLRHYVQQRGGRIPAEELFLMMEPVVRALDTVHQAGLVHRDISPDNIMLCYNGGAKLLDFGAVRTFDNMDADIDLSHSTEAILKHGFAPMEQYRSRGNMGPWTDEYGFCASVYYCLTGRVPPDAPSRAIEEAQPDWDSIPDLTPVQRYALEKGMSMRAKDRFGSMRALYRALYENVAPDDMPADTPKPREPEVQRDPRRVPVAAIVVAVIMVVAGALSIFARDQISGLLQSFTEKPAETLPAAQTQPPEQVQILPPVETEQAEIRETEPEAVETTVPREIQIEVVEPWLNNVMCSRPLTRVKAELANISSVTFVDNLADAPTNPNQIIDVSLNGDGSVVAWGEWDNGYRVVIAAEGGINAGADGCVGLFQGCANLQSVKFDTAFHSDYATSMEAMFAGCPLLNSVDLGSLNTRNVRSMRCMFSLRDPDSRDFHSSRWDNSPNHWLTSLDLRSLETGSVEDMSYMFYGRQKMTELLIDTWDVSGVRDMTKMFYQCCLVQELGVGEWDVSLVEDMSYTFGYCERLSKLDVSAWDVSSVHTMEGTFYYCNSMPNLDTSGWNVSNVRTMKSMFSYCSILQYVDVSQWDVSNVTNMTDMFAHCLILAEPEVDNWDISNVTAYNGFMDDGLINGRFWKYFFKDIGT